MPVQDEVPKSRITLTYKTEVDGEPSVVNLPLRLMVLGDFSAGTSKDRRTPLEERDARALNGRNTGEIMKDMGINVEMVVPNKVNPSEEEMRVQLNIDSMNSFTPDEVAKQIPQVRSLLLLKKLLEEIQSNVANKKEFAQLLSKLYADGDALGKMREKLQNYSMYRLPQAADSEKKQD
ncbi:MAG: type VI secretion system contractile sheath small subunit [Parachlamydia sp.]|nr:type VI secretion system contractile sheath small subunit [Parachlamydia sp.]